MRKSVTALLGAALTLVALAVPVGAAPAPVGKVAPAQSWANTGNPYVFALGDSVMDACVIQNRSGGGLGLGYRDLGHITWPGITTSEIRKRVQGKGTWPESTMSEESNAMEQTWFREAGALLIGLGTNDVRLMTPDLYEANVRWFLKQANGRPVVWITPHNPPYQSQIDVFNARLRKISQSYPNMKVLELDAFFTANPWYVRGDQVHPADGYACEAYDRLIAGAMAAEIGQDQPRGWWYGSSNTGNGVYLNGWASAWSNPRKDIARVFVKIDWQPYVDLPVTAPDAGGDQWADASSGRGWWLTLPASAAGHTVCVDLLDPKGQWTALGCRGV